MLIEVTGTGVNNKGAELMLVAIKEHFVGRKGISLAVDQGFGSYEDRARYGLRQKVMIRGVNRSSIGLKLLSANARKALGIVLDEDVDAVLDASGFAFGDQHPLRRSEQFADQIERAKTRGQKVILLPQALGPFNTPAMRNAFARIVNVSDLVFVRDKESMQHVESAVGVHDHVRIAPDFTNLVTPPLYEHSDNLERVCIVPNQRMVEKADSADSAAAYVPLLVKAINAVEAAGLEAVVLLHGKEDEEIAAAVRQRLRGKVKIHREEDPVELKAFLGSSAAVVGSRYHALVSALSQGIPTIGTSWSHKYEMLFHDYGCEEMLLKPDAAPEEVTLRIERALGEERNQLISTIRTNARKQKAAAVEMWRRVDEALGIPSALGQLNRGCRERSADDAVNPSVTAEPVS